MALPNNDSTADNVSSRSNPAQHVYSPSNFADHHINSMRSKLSEQEQQINELVQKLGVESKAKEEARIELVDESAAKMKAEGKLDNMLSALDVEHDCVTDLKAKLAWKNTATALLGPVAVDLVKDLLIAEETIMSYPLRTACSSRVSTQSRPRTRPSLPIWRPLLPR